MSVTITITKLHLAIAVVAVALVAPTTAAVAFHVFDDVSDDRFFSEAVEWAFDNDITTGTSATTFEPDANVTRGQNVTFAKRYDDNIVQPALTTATGKIATNPTGIAGLDTAQPFAATAFEGSSTSLTDTPTAYVTVTVTAPVTGHVTVNSTATVSHTVEGGDVLCVIVESTDIPPTTISVFAESVQWHETGGSSNDGSVSGTRTFAIAAGASIDYVLACEEVLGGGAIWGRNLTAIFTPAP
jgi:hypothetical protein